MSQQNSRNNPPQQGLQTTRAQQEQSSIDKAVPMSGTLTRLPAHGGATTNPDQANQWLEEAYEATGLVLAPFGNSVPLMPPGYGISVTPVQVTDFRDNFDGTQIYPIKGSQTKKGLLKTVLDACGTGMGFDWPPDWTWEEKFGDERDNDRLCVKITVCGRYKDVDGSWKTLPPQTKEIDLRDGSSEVNEIRARHLAKQLSDLLRDATPEARAERERRAKIGADNELAGPRKFIRSYAQTKARLMVIGTRMRRSYTLEELKRGPFYCFRVIQTWRSDDPETQKQFNQAIIDREMASSRALYGAPGGAAPRQLPPVSEEPYPEPQDAGVVGGADASTGENGPEQGNGSEAAATTVQGESGSNQPVQHCTAESGCLGEGSKHVLACYGKTAPDIQQEQSAEQGGAVQEEPWVLTQGSAKGLPVNDSRVTAQTLIQMEHELAAAIKPNGLLYDQLSEEKKDLLSQELRKIGQELDRRGITEGRLKK